MYQKLIIAGRLGRDAEMKFLPNGDPSLSFSMATDRTWTTKDNQRQKETTWWRVTIFGKIAQSLNEYLVKGASVVVEGRLRVDQKTGGPVVYQSKTGSWGSNFEVLADQIRLIGNTKHDSDAKNNDDVPF